ncbi:uncharacterized protein LOC115215853 [Argonauta hians]
MATSISSGKHKGQKRLKLRKDKIGSEKGETQNDRLFSVKHKENDCPSEQTNVWADCDKDEPELKSPKRKKQSGWKSIKKGVSEFQQHSRKILHGMITKVRQNSSKRRDTIVENINIIPEDDSSCAPWAVVQRHSCEIESIQTNHSFVSMEQNSLHECVAVVHDMEEELD